MIKVPVKLRLFITAQEFNTLVIASNPVVGEDLPIDCNLFRLLDGQQFFLSYQLDTAVVTSYTPTAFYICLELFYQGTNNSVEVEVLL